MSSDPVRSCIAAGSVALPERGTRRHRLPVRLAHTGFAFSVPVLLVTGAEILAHHPELYWGETGYFGDPAVISLGTAETSLRLGFALGEARSMHFATAWLLAAVLAGHLSFSLASGRFWRDLWPRSAELHTRCLLAGIAGHLRGRHAAAAFGYNGVQKLAYLVVLGLLLPLAFLTGLAMSPTIASASPELVLLLGGRQSARTLHAMMATALFLFFIGHLTLILLAGPRRLIRAISTGEPVAPAAAPVRARREAP